jgi:hypothetical protein
MQTFINLGSIFTNMNLRELAITGAITGLLVTSPVLSLADDKFTKVELPEKITLPNFHADYARDLLNSPLFSNYYKKFTNYQIPVAEFANHCLERADFDQLELKVIVNNYLDLNGDSGRSPFYQDVARQAAANITDLEFLQLLVERSIDIYRRNSASDSDKGPRTVKPDRSNVSDLTKLSDIYRLDLMRTYIIPRLSSSKIEGYSERLSHLDVPWHRLEEIRKP